MSVAEAIRQAEAILPGEPAQDGSIDPRWQAIIKVGDYIETEPQAVWQFIQTWGAHSQADLRMVVATCLLEHLLGEHFTEFFPRVEQSALADDLFADTFLHCWALGQTEEPANATRFQALKHRLTHRTRT